MQRFLVDNKMKRSLFSRGKKRWETHFQASLSHFCPSKVLSRDERPKVCCFDRTIVEGARIGRISIGQGASFASEGLSSRRATINDFFLWPPLNFSLLASPFNSLPIFRREKDSTGRFFEKKIPLPKHFLPLGRRALSPRPFPPITNEFRLIVTKPSDTLSLRKNLSKPDELSLWTIFCFFVKLHEQQTLSEKRSLRLLVQWRHHFHQEKDLLGVGDLSLPVNNRMRLFNESMTSNRSISPKSVPTPNDARQTKVLCFAVLLGKWLCHRRSDRVGQSTTHSNQFQALCR